MEDRIKIPTPSQKLRSVIYLVWERNAFKHLDFQAYYEKRIHEITEKMKLEIDQ